MTSNPLMNRERIGQALRDCRKAKDYSLRALAQLSGVSASHILRIESGEYDIQLETLAKLALHLNVPAGLIMEEGVVVNWMDFDSAVKADAGIAALLATRPKRTTMASTTAQAESVRFVAVSSAVSMRILLSSNPAFTADRFEFPSLGLREHYQEFFRKLGNQHSFADVAYFVKVLPESPASTLQNMGLLSKEILDEYLFSIQKDPKSNRWNYCMRSIASER